MKILKNDEACYRLVFRNIPIICELYWNVDNDLRNLSDLHTELTYLYYGWLKKKICFIEVSNKKLIYITFFLLFLSRRAKLK